MASKRGPESKFLDELKGQKVGIYFVGDKPRLQNPFRAKLVWVDHYTYGIEVGGKQRLVHKHSVQQIFRLTDGEAQGI